MQHLQEPEDLPDRQFYPKLGAKVGKVAKYSLLLRFCIGFLVSRGSIPAVLRNYRTILRFSLATSLFTLIYHLSRRIIRHLRKKRKRNISRDIEIAVACGLASISLHAATQGDQKIFKFIMYQRITTAAIRALGIETGLFTPIEEDSRKEDRVFTFESVVAVVTATFVCYCYVFEAPSVGK